MMRALVVSIWVFVNLVCFGMCAYMYLLWSQYWLYVEQHPNGAGTSTYDQQIFNYNRGIPNIVNSNVSAQLLASTEVRLHRVKHSTIIKNSKPRFPNVGNPERGFELDTRKFQCWRNDTNGTCSRRTGDFKKLILREMRRVFEDESNVLKSGAENPYKVQYKGLRGNFQDESPGDVLCQLQKIKIRTLRRGDIDKSSDNFKKLGMSFPRRDFFSNKARYNSCAIVSSAGSLKNSNLGKLIDSHDLVLRFNNAPTKGFEADVGAKTTIRIVNSQVIAKNEFNFARAAIFKNVTILAWDPSAYGASAEQWFEKPDFNLFPNYVIYRKSVERSRIFLVNPANLWELWDFLQAHSPSRLRPNPVSSGFLGLGALLPFCNLIHMFEYIPSTRATKKCHYYEPDDNPACTFGVWHPLAAEKLLSYHLNVADDETVFQKGFIRIVPNRDQEC